MKFFDTKAELAKIQNQGLTPATPATPATQTRQRAARVAGVAEVAAPKGEISKTEKSGPVTSDSCPKWFSAAGRPRTWTGKVVSLAEWRTLSEFERTGRGGDQ